MALKITSQWTISSVFRF